MHSRILLDLLRGLWVSSPVRSCVSGFCKEEEKTFCLIPGQAEASKGQKTESNMPKENLVNSEL